MNRSDYPTLKTTLSEQPTSHDLRHLTPEERVLMVEQLTRDAWTFKEGEWHESRLRRDVVRVIRNKPATGRLKDQADIEELDRMK